MLNVNKRSKTTPKPTVNFKNCSHVHVCAYHCVQRTSYTTQHRTVPIIFRLICIKINILIFVEVTDKTKLSPFMAHGVYCLFWVPRKIIMKNLVFVAKKCTTFHKSLSYIDYILPTFVKQDKCGVSNYTFHHTTPSRIDSQSKLRSQSEHLCVVYTA